MKNKEQRKMNISIPFFLGGILIFIWLLFIGLICLIYESYLLGAICIIAIVGLLYGLDYCRIKKLLFKCNMEKINETQEANNMEHTFLEEIPDEKGLKSVDVKFDLTELGTQNTFLLIKIPFSFIDEFKKYKHSLNSPSILGKKIYEWGDCDNGMCVQNVLCFSKEQIKSTIEQVTNEVRGAIEWLPNEHGDQSICIQKWVKFVWK